MRIITAGDHRFRDSVAFNVGRAHQFGLSIAVYDLGDVGLPDVIEWTIDDPTFKQTGRYERTHSTRPTAMHKPAMMVDAVRRFPGEMLLYLDGDAVMFDDPRGMMPGVEFDIALVCRRESERIVNAESRHLPRYRWTGQFNAGVMLFASTPGRDEFMRQWMQGIANECDQYVVNETANPDAELIEPGKAWVRGGVRYVSLGNEWNYRNCEIRDGERASIYHVVGGHKQSVINQALGKGLQNDGC